MFLEVKHKSIKIPAVHKNKDESDYDGDYIRRQLKQEYNRRSRSLDRSETSGSIRRMKKSNSREITLSRSKSSRINQHPTSPGSLTQTNRINSSSSGGRKIPLQRGIHRTFSSRICAAEPSSPGSPSATNKSCSSHQSSSTNSSPQRLRRARSLDASPRSLPRDEYIVTRCRSRKLLLENSESEISLSDTNQSSSTSTSRRNQKQSPEVNCSLRRLESLPKANEVDKSFSYRKLKKSKSSESHLSSCSGNTGLSSGSGNTKLTSGSGSIIGSQEQSSITDSSSTHTLDRSRSISSKHSSSEGLKRVSWKSDPKTGFSDWTLHIVYRDSNNKRHVDVYHVHRNIVAYGHRKSNYLLRDIMDDELKEAFDSTNKAELETKNLLAPTSSSKKSQKGKIPCLTILKLLNERQAAVVPLVLDFMYYTNEARQQISAERSCNVFKVAEGLKVRALQNAIGKFYERNLSIKNMEEFLQAATNSRTSILLAICKAKIRKMITAQPELSEMVPEEFLADILDHSYRSNTSNNVLDRSIKSNNHLHNSSRSRSRKKKKAFVDRMHRDLSFTDLVSLGVQ